MSEDFPLKEETYRILGACFEVYNEMGRGFLEPVHQECLELELQGQEIPFESQVTLELEYKGQKLEYTRFVNQNNRHLRQSASSAGKLR